jgi:hypothetical protein
MQVANPFDSVDFDAIAHDPISEDIVEVLCTKTQNKSKLFYRVLVAYYLSKISSMMHTRVKLHGRRELPVNIFAINLATSGFGKGHGVNIIEKELIHQFRDRYVNETFPIVASSNLPKIAHQRAARKQTDPDDEMARVEKEFESLGPIEFSFSEATVPAVKQLRHKLLMAQAGSLNLEIDEIGLNLLGSTDVLTAYLELFDAGDIKNKLTKNTNESKRLETVPGMTPANLLMFGTPSKLFNGGKVEDEFYSFLDTGYARRCFFGYNKYYKKDLNISGAQLYDEIENSNADQVLQALSDKFAILADPVNFNQLMHIPKDVMILLLDYKIWCERLADTLGEHEEMRKAEISHRYFKAAKLAAVYSFIDGLINVTEDKLMAAIKLAEESGKAFEQILNRDRNYVKLAKYLSEVGTEVTQADLVEVLPFYKGGVAQKQELLNLAIAYGYKNNIIIRKSYTDGIEFLSGESLKETNLDKMKVSYSTHVAYNYLCEEVPFDMLHKLTQLDGYHWCSHHFAGGHRCEEKTLQGFNMIVVDVDGGVSLDTAKLLLKDYKALYYTTKRHTEQENRFRIVLPLNYTLKMDAKEYKEFMDNIYQWLPFEVDTSTGQRSRKWLSHTGHYEYIDGQLLDVLPFIPKTSKNEEHKQRILDTQSLSNLERWFVNNTGTGNRSNQLIKYALLLVDSGKTWDEVRVAVLDLNQKIPDKLDDAEVMNTIMVTVSKAIASRDSHTV